MFTIADYFQPKSRYNYNDSAAYNQRSPPEVPHGMKYINEVQKRRQRTTEKPQDVKEMVSKGLKELLDGNSQEEIDAYCFYAFF